MPTASMVHRRPQFLSPLIIQSATSAWANNNFSVTLGSAPKVGNLLVAIYGGLNGTTSNTVNPPGSLTQINSMTQYNSSSANSVQLAFATRTVQSGDGTTWPFTIASSSGGIGAFIIEVASAGTVTNNMSVWDVNPNPEGGGVPNVSIASTPRSLMFGSLVQFTAMNGENGWGYAGSSGWSSFLTNGSGSYYAGMAVAQNTGTGGTINSKVTNTPVNSSNWNSVTLIINIAVV